jgi:transposase
MANHTSSRRAEEGIDLDVSKLADWVGASTATLAPLFTLLQLHVMAADRGDEHPLRLSGDTAN